MTRASPPPSAAAGPATLSQALTDKIRELLVQQGWSQREFARRLGVTQGAVSYLLAEKRRASALDYYEHLATIFGLRLSVLVADLEQRVGTHVEGVPDVSTPPANASAAEGGREIPHAALQFLFDSLLEARINAERHSARLSAFIAELAIDRRGRSPTPDAGKRRRPAPPKERADDRAESQPALRADPAAHHPLPAGRDASGRDLRRTG